MRPIAACRVAVESALEAAHEKRGELLLQRFNLKRAEEPFRSPGALPPATVGAVPQLARREIGDRYDRMLAEFGFNPGYLFDLELRDQQ